MMTQKMKDWNGKEVEFAKSKGGVCVLAHPFDNLIKSGCEPWPAPEVIQKLYRSNQVHNFDDSRWAICQSGVGYYCDLQSLHSEDAITWSVFGTAARAGRDKLKHWIADLFHLLNLKNASTEQAEVVLWRRIPHPDTLGFGGPEIDFGIVTGNSVVFGEAKWLSGVGRRNGTIAVHLLGQLRPPRRRNPQL